MRTFALLLAVLVGIAIARPQNRDATVVKYDNHISGEGNYNYAYETSDGIKVYEQGELENAGGEAPSITVTGSFSYLAPDGEVYLVTYEADATGFHPVGKHLPKYYDGGEEADGRSLGLIASKAFG